MIVAAPVLHRLAVGAAHDELGVARLDRADARERESELRRQGLDRLALLRHGREDELVIIAAGEHAVALELALFERAQRGRARDALVVDHRADLRALEDVAKVAGEAVGDVDRRVRKPAQALAQLDAGLRFVQPPRGLLDFWPLERKRGAAELTRYPDVIAGPRGAAIHRDARGHFAERDDADRDERRARRIAADELDAEAIG